MTTGKRLTEFGKREPAPLPSAPGPKRSNHVALLVMGTLAVGGGAYALMPSRNCQPPAPPAPGMAAPAMPQTGSGCTTRTSSGSGGGGGSSRYSFFSGGSSGGNSSGGGSSSSGASSGGVTRGGFGSFAHAFGFGGGG
jgi:hypothetical protein